MNGFTQIAEYLKKFQKINQPHKTLKQNFLAYTQKTTGITLLEKEIDIQNNAVYIKTDPITKNELFYKKNKLESFFKENPGCNEILFK